MRRSIWQLWVKSNLSLKSFSYSEEESECSATCGPEAFKTKTRTVMRQAEHGGLECMGRSKGLETCNLDPCPKDCRWSEWSTSQCTATCNPEIQNATKASRTKTRTILQQPANGGRECDGRNFDVEECDDLPTCIPVSKGSLEVYSFLECDMNYNE